MDPYRVLFPLGVAFAIAGAALWLLHAAGAIPYPASLHWHLMTQGFQHCFILGFLLTAMPSFMSSQRCRPWELGAAVAGMVGFGAATLLGAGAAAQACYVATILLVATMAARRLVAGAKTPPEEFLLAALGLLFGAVGGVWLGGVDLGWLSEPVPRFALRLVSMGMILSLVLGVGGLLVPTFSSMREPLRIPGIAAPHERRPRRVLYAAVALALVASFFLEAGGHAAAGAWLRAATGSTVLLLVWKLFRLPGRPDLLSFTLWGAGWMILLGLWLTAILPARPLLGTHVVLIGGFGFLSAGIATRVVVRHGGHALPDEAKVLRPEVVLLLALTVAARAAAEAAGAGPRAALLGASAAAWILAWIVWGLGAAPRLATSPRRSP